MIIIIRSDLNHSMMLYFLFLSCDSVLSYITSLVHVLFLQPKKLGFSTLTHLRRRRLDESTDYVCPIESSSPQSGQSAANGVHVRPYAGFRGLSPILDREPDRCRDQVGLDDGRADPSPWQRLWQRHGDTVSTCFPSTNQLSLLLLCLRPHNNTSACSSNPPVPYEWRDSEWTSQLLLLRPWIYTLTNPTAASNLCHDLTPHQRTQHLSGHHFLWHHFL